MAFQDFQISFTTTHVAEFNNHAEGAISPLSTLFADIVVFRAVGMLGTLFADIVAFNSVGMLGTLFADIVAFNGIGMLGTLSASELLGGIGMSNIIYQGDNGQILVNNLILTDKVGTGAGKITAAPGESWLAKGFRVEFESVTVSSSFVFRNDSGKTFTNDEAIIPTQIILPNLPGPGIFFTFVRVATQALRVRPSGGSIIYSGGQMGNGEYLELASDGAVLSVISDANGNWIATNEQGTLTEETP